MQSAIFLSVRNKATRLPGKVLLDLKGRSVTERLVERLRLARVPDLIVIATSTHPDDEIFVDVARRWEVEVFRGNEEDKLDRYLQGARRFDVDWIAVVDGDDPFCDPAYIDRLLQAARVERADFATVEDLPVGVSSKVVRVEALAKACEIKTEHDTEVWAGYFTETGLFRTLALRADPAHHAPHLRMTLDYPQDYEFFRAVYDHLFPPDRVFSLDEILALIHRQPEIGAINRGVVRLYEENLRRITKVGVKSGG